VLSSGELLRAARAAGTELGLVVAAYMDRGELVPDELVVAVIGDVVGTLGERPIIFDERLRVYHGQTEPLAAYFDGRQLLRRIDGARDVDSVEHGIRGALR
jgi:adenylate kinase family enzyme